MSTRRNTTANELVPQTDPEAIIRQANAEKRRIKANIEQHLLGLATGAIQPPSESFDPNFLTTKSFLTGTSSTSPTTTPDPTQTAPHSPLTDRPSITITQPPSPRIATPPQPIFNPLDLPSPFLKHNMSNDESSKGGNTPLDPATGGSDALGEKPTMSTDDYLKVLFATQQASLAQVQADREEYNRRLARQDADAAVRLAESTSRIARLEEALIGMTIKSQTPERQTPSAGDDVNLRTFRTSDGPTYTGPYQEVEPFLLWLNSLDMFFRAKDISNERTMIILTGSFIKESNLLKFFATDSKRLLDGTWTAFRTELMATALPSRWQTVIRKQLRFFKMTASESFAQFVARGRSLQLMLNFDRTMVTDIDLAEGITFGLPETVESDIYKLRLLEDSPFIFSEFVARATDCYNTVATSQPRSRGTGTTGSARTDTPFLPQDDYVWRIHSYLDSVHIPTSFVAPPKPANYVAPTAWTKAQAASGKAPPPHVPAGRQTSRPAGVAGISDEEMWPEYDHLSEVALDAIDAQAAICETLTRDKICAAADEAILAEFGDLSIPATVLSSEEERFPEDSVDADRYAPDPSPSFSPLRLAARADAHPTAPFQHRSVASAANPTNRGGDPLQLRCRLITGISSQRAVLPVRHR
ncbi:hypothetical protein PSTT_06824 [Puccinia striiformis]|uniref:Uncharacterized protein n=1 Tax=Puccinia striiformis TaxID=27350 RepID=A0A2S4VIR4_9BASI|nr:hypothetical protein PSTT_06824 [Puccinia striiformis]